MMWLHLVQQGLVCAVPSLLCQATVEPLCQSYSYCLISCMLRNERMQVYTTEAAADLFVVQCSATCGEGVQPRNVSCPYEGLCDSDQKPLDRRLCDAGPCLQWIVDSWSQVRRNRNTCANGLKLYPSSAGDLTTKLLLLKLE